MRIPADHPALAGHFLGEPIVPGVVLLDYVLRAAGKGKARFPSVKFHAPLRPGEEFEVYVDKNTFKVQRGNTLIASGSFRLA
jgi:3-hydroxymyristoyl/3-hydroxydecanoyl-(acyl carrier protein) dehydratase